MTVGFGVLGVDEGRALGGEGEGGYCGMRGRGSAGRVGWGRNTPRELAPAPAAGENGPVSVTFRLGHAPAFTWC